MKIAILGDTHFLFKEGSSNFNRYFEKFYSNIFFPYLIKNNITTVIQCGDSFDNRRTAHVQAFAETKKYFFNKFDEYNIKLISIVGNHDSFYKNTIKTNSPSLLLKEYKNIKIIDDPSFHDDLGIDFIPWICDDNRENILDYINNSKNNICVGHFEIENFSMYKGIPAKHGLDSKIFSKYEYVFSGHYHTRSSKDNIYYVGIPYELTWHDCNDPKGFHIFDLETRKLTFHENPYKIFHKILYDTNQDFSEFVKYENSYIKVFVDNIEDGFDEFIDHLNKANPIKISIIENIKNTSVEDEDIDETEDTLTIMDSYINNIKNKEVDSFKLKSMMNELYSEAVLLESSK